MKKIGSKRIINNKALCLVPKEIEIKMQLEEIGASLKNHPELFQIYSYSFGDEEITSVAELCILEPEEIQEYIEFKLEKEEWKKWRESRQSYSFTTNVECKKEDIKKLFGKISKVYIGESK